MRITPLLRDGEQKVFFKAGSEWCFLWTPTTFSLEEPMPVVIHHHGGGGHVTGESADWLEEPQKIAYMRAIMEGSGCAIAGSHACGDHWGNADAVAANKSLFDALVECPNIDAEKVDLISAGLGSILLLNSFLGPFTGQVKKMAIIQGVASLEAVIRDHRYKPPCLRAFNISEDISDDEAISLIAPHDPLPRIQRLPLSISLPRTIIFHGAEDVNIPPRHHSIPLAEGLRKAGGEATLELFPDIGHSVYSVGKPLEEKIKEFFTS